MNSNPSQPKINLSHTNQNTWSQVVLRATNNEEPTDLYSAAWLNQLDRELPKVQKTELLWMNLDMHISQVGLEECHPACAIRQGKKFFFSDNRKSMNNLITVCIYSHNKYYHFSSFLSNQTLVLHEHD